MTSLARKERQPMKFAYLSSLSCERSNSKDYNSKWLPRNNNDLCLDTMRPPYTVCSIWICSSYDHLLCPPIRPSLSQSTDTGSANRGPRPNLLPKFAISAESEGEETSGLGDPSKTSISIGELPRDEHDATTPGSTHSGATLSGKSKSNKYTTM